MLLATMIELVRPTFSSSIDF